MRAPKWRRNLWRTYYRLVCLEPLWVTRGATSVIGHWHPCSKSMGFCNRSLVLPILCDDVPWMVLEEFPSLFLLYFVSMFAFHYMLTLRTMCNSSIGGGGGLEKSIFYFFCICFFCFLLLFLFVSVSVLFLFSCILFCLSFYICMLFLFCCFFLFSMLLYLFCFVVSVFIVFTYRN